MSFNYLSWQYYYGPLWIVTTAWNIHRAILRYFSVPVMVRTLFSHWHKDRIVYKSSTLSGYVKIWALNQISRAIGFLVRCGVIATWLLLEIGFIPLFLIALIAFLLWPVIIIVTLMLGIQLLWLGSFA